MIKLLSIGDLIWAGNLLSLPLVYVMLYLIDGHFTLQPVMNPKENSNQTMVISKKINRTDSYGAQKQFNSLSVS